MGVSDSNPQLLGYVFCVSCNALNYLYSMHRWPSDKPYLCTYCRVDGDSEGGE